MYKRLKSVFKRVINIGCDGDDYNAHKIRVCNTFALLSCSIVLLDACIFVFFYQSLTAVLMNMLLVTACCLALILQYYKYHYAAGLMLFLSVISFIFVQAYGVVGNEVGVQNTFLTLLPLPWLLLEGSRRSTKILLSVLCCSCYFFIEYHQPIQQLITLKDTHKGVLQILYELLAMLVLILIAITFDNDRYKFEKKLKRMATIDGLTGLSNRTKLFIEGDRALCGVKRHKLPFCVALMDIDHFKKVNDNYGHSHGDAALQIVAKLLANNTRQSDIIGRYGGEEFALILQGTELSSAIDKLNSIREKIEAEPICYGSVCINCTASFGVTQLTNPGQNLTDLFDQADSALYDSKDKGRNCVSVYPFV
ncbi:GGDEF domain-containing protein [Pseudoalteromonas obscura]|uniref:diguanylate cyclase n=1 Tax=Pseudoalteromonas obscura TaxID=3048491 RepID=A0ABT7EDY0_9GAMM|nr:GGDEF domain-containing protein [Pseudoalteromonas sp. P94(2023)]MDK2593474.1 GGDEF domain-containing protein [Pseudoalteromonas sp. P94(2023)]